MRETASFHAATPILTALRAARRARDRGRGRADRWCTPRAGAATVEAAGLRGTTTVECTPGVACEEFWGVASRAVVIHLSCWFAADRADLSEVTNRWTRCHERTAMR